MCEQFVQTLMISLGLFCNTHTGEECELTCRDNNSDVVILLSNMTADSVRKEHWRNPPKVKVCVCVCHKSHRHTSRSTAAHDPSY